MADPGLPDGEGALTLECGAKTYYLTIFLPKTAWKWDKLDLGECVPRVPLGAANDYVQLQRYALFKTVRLTKLLQKRLNLWWQIRQLSRGMFFPWWLQTLPQGVDIVLQLKLSNWTKQLHADMHFAQFHTEGGLSLCSQVGVKSNFFFHWMSANNATFYQLASVPKQEQWNK